MRNLGIKNASHYCHTYGSADCAYKLRRGASKTDQVAWCRTLDRQGEDIRGQPQAAANDSHCEKHKENARLRIEEQEQAETGDSNSRAQPYNRAIAPTAQNHGDHNRD